ncbi:MAG: DUF4013 domain-containing protein [Ignavibacteriales bacterium]|nr:DUF4013 domain-containing protein [Ignavibacteriales bacterium]
MKKLTAAIALIFSNDDWFNKILIGGFYISIVVTVVPIVMINGFIVEFMKSVMRNSKELPYWRNSKSIFKTGWKVSLALIFYYAAATLLLTLTGISVISVQTAVLFFILHTTLHPVILLAYAREQRFSICFNLSVIGTIVKEHWKDLVPALAISAALLFVAITLGWMWIVVGWPLLVFLALIVQNTMVVLSVQPHFLNHS